MIEQETLLSCSFLQGKAPLGKYQLMNANVEPCKFEAKLQESEDLYRLILSNISDAVFITDDSGGFTFVCPNTEFIFGYSSQETENFGNVAQLLGDDLFDIDELKTSREIRNLKRTVRDKTGRYHTVLINVKSVEIQGGTRLYSCRDITDCKITEKTLHHASEELEKRVDERTAQISESNALLRAELIERKRVEERLRRSEAELQQANEKLVCWVDELEQRNQEMSLLGKMSDFLQTCLTVEDAYSALATLVQPMFLGSAGGVFVLETTKNQLEAVATWGTSLPSKLTFSLSDCWAVRRRHSRFVQLTRSNLLCPHIQSYPPCVESLCVPMIAGGKALGLLYLSSSEAGRLTDAKQKLGVTVAEHMALAISNLKLWETLKHESIHDPLTGLFNRRYMQESLKREIYRARRQGQPVGVIMIDIDHFKQFNDAYGHEAGDRVLKELASFLQSNIRSSDIACRYGGEELLLILPDASLIDTQHRAEQLREGVKQLRVRYRHQNLSSITISLGVACCPEQGLTGEAVIQAADMALYQAKKLGRDRVAVACEESATIQK
jgi:diguanylate cyclase (GGDEF)-like protein/PAS domain S-box-containing protein